METVNNNGADNTSVTNTHDAVSGSGETAPLTTQVRQQARELVQVTQRTASDLAGQVQTQVTSRLTDQKNVASDALHQVADVLRQAGEGFRGHKRDALGEYADTASLNVSEFSEYLERSDLQTLTRDAESVARRQPALFVGGAFLAGLLLGRFLRSSGSGGSTVRANSDPYLPAKIPASTY